MSRQRSVGEEVRLARGRNLLRERTRGGLTLEGLGEKVGVSGEQVRKYQIGRDFLDAYGCWRFAQAIGCRFGSLFHMQSEAGVAEPPAAFAHDAADAGRLAELLEIAQAQLTGARRIALRDILLDMLDEEETAPPAARPAFVAPPQGIL